MSMRKLSLMAVVLALTISASAFAAEEPPVAPISQDEFLATLQDQSENQPDDAQEALPELEGAATPELKHGNCFFYDYVCRGCTLPNGSRGLQFCQSDRCLYNGSYHYHYYNCRTCTTACST